MSVRRQSHLRDALSGSELAEGKAMKVILNADDFGRSNAINAAVSLAHTQGVLTSASLMVTGGAVEEAVELARRTPSLAVGLHLVTMAGRAQLPFRQIPHLVDARGYFPTNPLRIGLRCFFSPIARRELAQEMEAQFDRFAATGLPLSHVDGHCHMHVHPAVFDLLLPLAEQYGATGIRLPRDELRPALRFDSHAAGIKLAWAITYALLCRRCAHRLRSDGLVTTHRVFGLMQTGRMQEGYVVDLLRHLRAPTAEIYFHPSVGPSSEKLGPNPTDLATLLSPLLRQVMAERGLEPATYSTLRESSAR
jgi:chitin disaccharide deacetylase